MLSIIVFIFLPFVTCALSCHVVGLLYISVSHLSFSSLRFLMSLSENSMPCVTVVAAAVLDVSGRVDIASTRVLFFVFRGGYRSSRSLEDSLLVQEVLNTRRHIVDRHLDKKLCQAERSTLSEYIVTNSLTRFT